jgi:hypothetical protein
MLPDALLEQRQPNSGTGMLTSPLPTAVHTMVPPCDAENAWPMYSPFRFQW